MQRKNRYGNQNQEGEQVTRARIPRGREVMGLIEQRVGGSRMIVKCFDGKSRNCRVPGRYKRSLWLREGDFVLIEPWQFDDAKGDIIFKYSKSQVDWLKNKGFLKEIESEF